jgi:hypothetical protein
MTLRKLPSEWGSIPRKNPRYTSDLFTWRNTLLLVAGVLAGLIAWGAWG